MKEKELQHTKNISNNVINKEIMIKRVVTKCLEDIYNRVDFAVCKYYQKTNNIDKGDMNFVVDRFEEAMDTILILTPILEELLIRDISGIEDVVITVYGISSNEAYLMKKFLELHNRMTEQGFNSNDMWNDFADDKRLKDMYIKES